MSGKADDNIPPRRLEMAQQAKVDPRIQIAEQPVLEVIMPWLRVLLGEVEVLEQRSEDVLKKSTVTFRVQVDADKLQSRLFGPDARFVATD